jgi:GNAT superfamily N-acetyltransferase
MVTRPSAAPPEEPRALIRPATERDCAAIERLVGTIAGEVYGHLFQGAPPRPDGKWAQGLVAQADGRIVAVMVADDDWIEDLWVAADWRRRGVGGRLLSAGERQIAGRGCEVAHLRVIAENQGARRFYARQGWSEVEAYPHEAWGFEMIDMVKRLAPEAGVAE